MMSEAVQRGQPIGRGDKSNVIGGWLLSVTLALDDYDTL